MGRRITAKKPRQRIPLPLQRPWVKGSKKREDEIAKTRRKLRPWQRPEDAE